MNYNAKLTIKIQLQEFLQHFKPIQTDSVFITPKDFKKKVDSNTVNNYARQTLNPLDLSSHVYFLRSEVKTSLKPLNV
jgi:hypothetical protein